MTLKEFASRCWYKQELYIVDYNVIRRHGWQDRLATNPGSLTIAKVTPVDLHQYIYEELAERKVISYGVIDNHLIVEVVFYDAD